MSASPSESAESALAALPPRRSLRQASLTLAWREAGSGPAVVFLHGLLGNADSWVLQFADLAASHRVVAWDAPGYGGSSPLGPDIAAYADALAVLLARLGLEGATVVGHSMGGVVAALAAARPASLIGRVVLSCSHPGYAAPPDTPPTAKLLGPGLCGLGLAGAAVEQQYIQRVFDLPNAVGEGAGHQPQLPGGGGKAACFGNHLQHGQAVRCEDVASVLHGRLIFVQAF